jgi:hypothetical protein
MGQEVLDIPKRNLWTNKPLAECYYEQASHFTTERCTTKHPKAFTEAAIRVESVDTTISQYFQPRVLQMGTTFMGDLENTVFAVLMYTGIITSYSM